MKYPECEKLALVSDKSQIIGEFISWLGEQEIELGKWDQERLRPCSKSVESLLAEFFEINMAKVEKERREMLEQIQRPTKKG